MNIERRIRIKRILSNPFILAVPIATALILMIPDVFEKYIVELDHEKVLADEQSVEYYDLNQDGNSEWFYAASNRIGGSAISIHDFSGVLNQWNFDGAFMPNEPKCIVGDYNNDGICEIYAFTMKGDSLLINGIDFQIHDSAFAHNRLIDIIRNVYGSPNFALRLISLDDLNGDGCKEVIFVVSAGYGIRPRRVFAYDVHNDTVFCSPELGGHISKVDTGDIDNDGHIEFAITNYGPGNIKDKNLPMQDTCSYVLVLDNDLSFLFDPISSPGKFCGINNQFLSVNGKHYVASYWGYNPLIDGLPALKIYDVKGDLLKARNFNDGDRQIKRSLTVYKVDNSLNYILLSSGNSHFELYDYKLNLHKKISLAHGGREPEFYDFDMDGQKEMFFELTKPGEWCILRSSLSHPAMFRTHASPSEPVIYSIKTKGQEPKFCFQLDNHLYILKYGLNPFYYWQYVFYLVIYVIIILIILIVKMFHQYQLKRKTEAENKMKELQLLLIRNQMDPHFTFNVLNTIGSVILQNKGEEAYEMLLKFSRMIRNTVSASNRISRTLQEEISFVRTYLELQQNLHKGTFTYQIKEDAGVAQDKLVPQMMLHTYAENALKHGLMPRNAGGILEIEISQSNEHLKIKVTDNGVGREQAKISGTVSTKAGLSILHQFYQILNSVNRRTITEDFIDIYDENGRPAGTTVLVNIPLDFEYPGVINQISASY